MVNIFLPSSCITQQEKGGISTKGDEVLGNYEVAGDVSQERQRLEFRVNEIYGMLLRCQEVINIMRIIICLLLGANIGMLLIASHLMISLLQANG